MLKFMRPALQKAIEKMIKDKAHEFDSMLYQVKLEADRALQEVSNINTMKWQWLIEHLGCQQP